MPAEITIDEQEWTDLVRLLGTIDAKKVARRATKDVAKTVRTRIARLVNQEFAQKYGDILKGIKATSTGETGAKVDLRGRRPSLRSFRGTPKKPRHEMARSKSGRLRKATYRYEIERGQKRTAKDVFVQRTSRAGYQLGSGLDRYWGRAMPFKRKRRSRYPLVVPRGPSVPAIYQAKNQNKVAREVLKDSRALLRKRIHGQMFRLVQQQMRTVSRQVERIGA